MRGVVRSRPAPAALDATNPAGLTEQQRARNHIDDTDPDKGSFTFAVYKHDEVKLRLAALFHGKCAYCETFYSASAPVDIEHYRPKGAVAEDGAHPGYWWVAMDWDNLLPSCIDCNRKRKQRFIAPSTSLAELNQFARAGGGPLTTSSGKKDSFPIAGARAAAEAGPAEFAAEAALLLDPCRDRPDDHLAYPFDPAVPVAVIVPRANPGPSARGATSIQIYGLNRLGLVQDRTRILRQLEFLADLVIELGEMGEALASPAIAAALAGTPGAPIAARLQLLRDRILAEMRAMAEPQAPYSAMVGAWLAHFRERLAA